MTLRGANCLVAYIPCRFLPLVDSFTRRLEQLEVCGKRTSRNDIGTCPAIRGGWPAFTPWYVVDKVEYVARLKELGAAYREAMGKNFPAMTCVEVAAWLKTARGWRSRSRRWCLTEEKSPGRWPGTLSHQARLSRRHKREIPQQRHQAPGTRQSGGMATRSLIQNSCGHAATQFAAIAVNNRVFWAEVKLAIPAVGGPPNPAMAMTRLSTFVFVFASSSFLFPA
jgi:hypothetical protein